MLILLSIVSIVNQKLHVWFGRAHRQENWYCLHSLIQFVCVCVCVRERERVNNQNCMYGLVDCTGREIRIVPVVSLPFNVCELACKFISSLQFNFPYGAHFKLS